MTVHYISDLHLDFYGTTLSLVKTEKLYNKLFQTLSGDVLIIAGDISHYNIQTKLFLDVCSEKFNKIFVISGNHEMYNISKKQRYKYLNSYSKINELKEMLEPLEKVHFLDGNTVTYKGIRFGGAMGWYDGSYYYKVSNGMYSETMQSHWKNYSNDANLIPGLKTPTDLFSTEIQKIKNALEQKPDVMITHFSPVSESVTFTGQYKNDRGSGYYCFNGLHLIDTDWNKHVPKYWVHGHIHDSKEFKIYGTTHVRNPLGYPGEKDNFELLSFEVNKGLSTIIEVMGTQTKGFIKENDNDKI